MKYLKVAVNSPFNSSILTYHVPRQAFYENRSEGPRRGELVYAPLGKRKVQACVLQAVDDPGLDDLSLIKDLAGPHEWDFQFHREHLDFLEWVSDYYQYPLGQLIFDFLPKPAKRPKKLKIIEGKKEVEYCLNKEQEKVWLKAQKGLHRFSQYLLHGVTGSGKSIIYFKAMEKIILEGKSVLFLLPEINLTPQFIENIKKCIQAPLISYHSSMTKGQRYGVWDFLQKNRAPVVVVGVRSALFLPLHNLGLIIVDEEHDSSFKQENHCPYNARDLALKMGGLKKIPVFLGSATPSVETFYRFQNDSLKSFYLPMPKRYGKAELPQISLLDARAKKKRERGEEENESWPFLEESLSLIEEKLNKKEQVLVFLNRLGFASYLQCRSCGYQFFCPHCSIPLKVFKKRGHLNCHTCDYRGRIPDECPECGNLKLNQMGFGTEKLEEVLKQKFSKARIGRFDRDDLTTFIQVKKRLEEFRRGEIDLLVGTQMLAKGHNFENVNLVVVLGIDNQLNFPDYRSAEKVYQILTQISGRAGRYASESKVVVQTLNPENKIFQFVKNHSFDDYYWDEIKIRNLCRCPPYHHLVMLYFISRQKKRAMDAAKQAVSLHYSLKKKFLETDCLGPRPAFIEKRVNKYAWVVMLRSKKRTNLHSYLKGFKSCLKIHSSVSLKVDIDPYSIN